MDEIKNVVIIGNEDTGKTTLANALLAVTLPARELFPQSYDGVYTPTLKCDSRMLTQTVQLTDTPGYSLLWNTIPEEVETAAATADTLIVMLSEEMEEEVVDIPPEDPMWEKCKGKEEKLLENFLKGKTRDIYFVIPYNTEDWPEDEPIPLSQALRFAQRRFSRFTDHGENAFFCIDPMQALEGELWLDDNMLEISGILPLRKVFLGKDV